jgi:hypothetical protein
VERLIEQTAQDGREKSGANGGWKEMRNGHEMLVVKVKGRG